MVDTVEFKRTEFVFKLDEKEYRVKHPSVMQVEALQKEYKKDDEKKQDLGVVISFLENLGLPKDVSYGMEPGHLETIVDSICGSKKK